MNDRQHKDETNITIDCKLRDIIFKDHRGS